MDGEDPEGPPDSRYVLFCSSTKEPKPHPKARFMREEFIDAHHARCGVTIQRIVYIWAIDEKDSGGVPPLEDETAGPGPVSLDEEDGYPPDYPRDLMTSKSRDEPPHPQARYVLQAVWSPDSEGGYRTAHVWRAPRDWLRWLKMFGTKDG